MPASATNELLKLFKRELVGIGRKMRCELPRSFVHWFVQTRFEAERTPEITDGTLDGGIDALVHSEGLTFVVQTEFEESFFRGLSFVSPLDPKKYAQFDALPATFADKKAFEAYSKTLRPELVNPYKRLAGKVQADPESVVWEISTLHSRSRAGEGRLREVDPHNIRYAVENARLFELSLEGATPPPRPLDLRFLEHFTAEDGRRGLTTHVAQVYAGDFIKYLDDDPQFRVLARNVRSELTDTSAKEIRRQVIDTYRNHAKDFWYSHNGIVLVCDRATTEKKRLSLTNPYVINGAQTIHALRDQDKGQAEAKILVRAIEIPPAVQRVDGETSQEFINKIILRTNQQNKMLASDLRANDSRQVELEKKFAQHGVFYERRRGDWNLKSRFLTNQALDYSSIVDLSRVLVSCLSDEEKGGVAVAKKGKDEMFKPGVYESAFDRPFDDILFKFRLSEFVMTSIGGIRWKAITQRERNHAYLSVLAITSRSLESASERQLRRWTDETLRSPGKWDVDRREGRTFRDGIREVFWGCWEAWTKEAKRDPSVSANNFFKSQEYNHRLMRTIAGRLRGRLKRGIADLLA